MFDIPHAKHVHAFHKKALYVNILDNDLWPFEIWCCLRKELFIYSVANTDVY